MRYEVYIGNRCVFKSTESGMATRFFEGMWGYRGNKVSLYYRENQETLNLISVLIPLEGD